jgi:pyruvate dehydrogenase E2 component (dihydrolipoamide acetyltransferase)
LAQKYKIKFIKDISLSINLCYIKAMAISIKMPKLSPTMETGVLSQWLVEVGDIIKTGDIIAEIETDKAIMEVEALEDGIIGYIANVAQKETPVNSVIGYIIQAGEEPITSWEEQLAKDNNAFNALTQLSVDQNTLDVHEPTTSNHTQENNDINKRIFASPLAKKIATLRGINLNHIQGSGPNGRIIKADLNEDNISYSNNNINYKNEKHVIENSYEIPMNNMRKIIAQRLSQAKKEIPHIYLNKKICIDALEKIKETFLTKFNTKISMTPFFIKAAALALKQNTNMNVTFENEKIIQHNSYHINIAIAVEGGLVVPVVKNADEKTLIEIANELKELTILAKQNKLTKDHLQTGTLSISNLGMYGIDSFDAIINPPQVAILAIAACSVQAVWDEDKFIPRKIMKYTLSCDHRVIDGEPGAKFVNSFAMYLENPEGMLL